MRPPAAYDLAGPRYFSGGRRYAQNRVGRWQQAQIEWLSGPIDGMRVHPTFLSTLFLMAIFCQLLKFEGICGDLLKSGALAIYKIDYSLFRDIGQS